MIKTLFTIAAVGVALFGVDYVAIRSIFAVAQWGRRGEASADSSTASAVPAGRIAAAGIILDQRARRQESRYWLSGGGLRGEDPRE